MKSNETNTKFVWIGGNATVSKKMNGSYFFLFQELKANLFSLVKNLKLDWNRLLFTWRNSHSNKWSKCDMSDFMSDFMRAMATLVIYFYFLIILIDKIYIKLDTFQILHQSSLVPA